MAYSGIAQKAGLKLFEKHLKQYEPVDPLYETYTDKKGRQKRRKREIPPGLSKRDARILKSVKKRAHHLDTGLNLCGFRIGWTFIFGIVPGAGDALNAALGYYLVIQKAKQADIPPWLHNRMLGNQAVATVIGLVPIVGDVGIAMFKTNFRNAALLEEYLRIRGEEFLKVQADRIEDPAVLKPGAGKDEAEKIPGKSSSQKRFGFFPRSAKKSPVVEDEGTPTEAEDELKEKTQTKSGQGKKKSR